MTAVDRIAAAATTGGATPSDEPTATQPLGPRKRSRGLSDEELGARHGDRPAMGALAVEARSALITWNGGKTHGMFARFAAKLVKEEPEFTKKLLDDRAARHNTPRLEPRNKKVQRCVAQRLSDQFRDHYGVAWPIVELILKHAVDEAVRDQVGDRWALLWQEARKHPPQGYPKIPQQARPIKGDTLAVQATESTDTSERIASTLEKNADAGCAVTSDEPVSISVAAPPTGSAPYDQLLTEIQANQLLIAVQKDQIEMLTAEVEVLKARLEEKDVLVESAVTGRGAAHRNGTRHGDAGRSGAEPPPAIHLTNEQIDSVLSRLDTTLSTDDPLSMDRPHVLDPQEDLDATIRNWRQQRSDPRDWTVRPPVIVRVLVAAVLAIVLVSWLVLGVFVLRGWQ